MTKITITGTIIRIPDRSTVIINRGTEHGVATGTMFQILGKPETIVDPGEHESLGAITIVKGRVKVSSVYQKFCLAQSNWRESRLRWLAGWTKIAGEPLTTEEEMGVKELNVRPEHIKPWRAVSEDPVSVGDSVRADIEMLDSKADDNATDANDDGDAANGETGG